MEIRFERRNVLSKQVKTCFEGVPNQGQPLANFRNRMRYGPTVGESTECGFPCRVVCVRSARTRRGNGQGFPDAGKNILALTHWEPVRRDFQNSLNVWDAIGGSS